MQSVVLIFSAISARDGQKACFYFMCLAVFFMIGGCATSRVKNANLRVTEQRLLTITQTKVSEKNMGLALSGGGSRASSFDIGVLKALYEYNNNENLIKDFDYISSVSGGSWAGYWFYTKEMFKDCTSDPVPDKMAAFCNKYSQKYRKYKYETKDIFATKEESKIEDPLNKYRFQYHLENNSKILNVMRSEFMQSLENGFNIGLHSAEAMTAHKILDGVFNTVWDTSVLKKVYRKGLERAYGFVPVDLSDPEKSIYHNSENGTLAIWNEIAQAKAISFSELSAFLNSRVSNDGVDKEKFRMPIPIINTAMGYSGETPREFKYSVFWITPNTYGSSEDEEDSTDNTYEGSYEELNFSEAVAASGAAVDGQARGVTGAADVGLWLIDGNLGYNVRNPKSGQNKYFNTGLLPFPIYPLLNRYYYKEKRPIVRLSDGGHADNLGVYALIQRQVENIVIIDAEHDPNMDLTALKYLGERLKQENMGYKIIFTDDCKDTSSFRRLSTKTSVRTGIFKSEDSNKKDLKFYYLKLSFDEDRINLSQNMSPDSNHCAINPKDAVNKPYYPCSIVDFYKTELERKKQDRFPHNSTADVFYDELQYKAYRDLGYLLATEQLIPKF